LLITTFVVALIFLSDTLFLEEEDEMRQIKIDITVKLSIAGCLFAIAAILGAIK
jgi:hypothetical protein